jgi:hypothetical protein
VLLLPFLFLLFQQSFPSLEHSLLDNAFLNKNAKMNNSLNIRIIICDFYFRALGSLVILSFPQLLSFSSVFPKPLSETLRRSSDGRISV